jgi:F-type H+-transporting ATPase subunit b
MKAKMKPARFKRHATSQVRAGAGAVAPVGPPGHSLAAASAQSNPGFAAAHGKALPVIFCRLLAVMLLAFVSMLSLRAAAQDKSAAPTKPAAQSAPEGKGFGRELAEQTRESTGSDEKNTNLTHAKSVQWLARKTGLSVHQAHLVALTLNFAIVVAICVWAYRKVVPGLLRGRSQSIQQALEEARAASQDAKRRLSDIETRLRQLEVEIGRMQATAEKEAEAEEGRIHQAAEEDIRKVVLAAEQEIVAAAKQARRELTIHSAGLALALASKQINVDSNTDQVLVRAFGANLKPQASTEDNDGRKDSR